MADKAIERVVITGGAGFIGSHVAHRFAAAGAEVHVIDNLVHGHRSNLAAAIPLHACDAGGTEALQLIRSVRPDAVLHFAADAAARRRPETGGRDDDVRISERLFTVACESRPDVTLLFASTVAITAGHRAAGLSAYADGKRRSEEALASIARRSGATHVTFRLTNVYGPRQNGSSAGAVVPSFARALAEGRSLIIHGDGEQTRDFIHVDDVAEAAWRATTRRLERTSVIVASGRATSVLDVARLSCEVAGVAPSFDFIAPLEGEARHSRPDASPSHALLGWQPTVGLEAGLERTIAWYLGAGRIDWSGACISGAHADRMASHDSRPVYQRQALADIPRV